MIKFKKTHPDAQLPSKGRINDTGYDVSAVESKIIPAGGSAVVSVGLQFAYIDPDFWVRIGSRSGLGFKHGIVSFPGVIDSEYRGDAGIKLFNLTDDPYTVTKGERIAQLIIHRRYASDIEWSDTIHETVRGASGFGSSGTH